ncbi:MAG: FAD-dependent monooxygenase [Gemmatimonadaceae bacterium]
MLIVGAGPTGLALAIWLTRLDVRVRIIDRAAEPSTTSRALAVQARVLEMYDQLGIASAVIARGFKGEALNLWIAGRRAAVVPLAPTGEGMTPFPFVLIFPQDEHERLLIAELSRLGVVVERSTTLTSLTQDESGVHAMLLQGDGSTERCDALYVAGCDGARSAVRRSIGIDFTGGTYSQYFYVADVQGTGPTTNGEVHVALDTADFLIVFPIKGPGRTRLIGVARDRGGADQRDVTFDEVSHVVLQQVGVTVSKVNWFSTYHVHHRVASRFRERRAFLLGDAAHIHSPVGGQGMNTGISDAINLSWKLAAVIQGRGSGQLLDSYEPERIAFAQRLVATTDRLFTLATAQGKLAAFVRTRIVPRVVPVLARVAAIRRFMFRTVSQLVIQYRSSPLSTGRAGRVHAGDRLPWVRGSAHDNFAALTALAWQLHVYGDPPPDAPATCAALGLTLHVFPWSPAAEAAGLARSALYLIRPDGYVGFADETADLAALRRYAARWQLAPSPSSRPS